jgi:hypothetical protein
LINHPAGLFASDNAGTAVAVKGIIAKNFVKPANQTRRVLDHMSLQPAVSPAALPSKAGACLVFKFSDRPALRNICSHKRVAGREATKIVGAISDSCGMAKAVEQIVDLCLIRRCVVEAISDRIMSTH